MAAYITGGVTVPGAAGGIIISGLIVKVRRLQLGDLSAQKF